MLKQVKVPSWVTFNVISGQRLGPRGKFEPPEECPTCRSKLIGHSLLKGTNCPHCRRPIKQACANCGANRHPGADFCLQCGYGEFTGETKARKNFTVCSNCSKPGTGRRCTDPSCNGRLLIGVVLDGGDGVQYRVEKFLGLGGMGMVYEVIDPSGARYALKEIRPLGDSGDLDPRLLYRNEIEAMDVLRQVPEVVRIERAFQEGVASFVVMQHLGGRTVEQLMENGPLDKRLVWNILYKLTEIVAKAQAYAVLRDLKASNVMVMHQDPVALKVFDLGFVHNLTPGSFQFGSDMVLGTPGYGPPEQFGRELLLGHARIVREINHRFMWSISLPDPEPPEFSWDVHAIGAIGYFMVTGVNPSTILYDWDMYSVSGSYDDRLKQILRSALAHRPYDRYKNAAQMFMAMRKLGSY